MEINDAGPPTLSERELQVLELVATGATNQQIARNLVISANTVKVHLRNIFGKLGVESRTEAALYAIREGWIAVEGVESLSEAIQESPVLPREYIPAWRRILFVLAALLIALVVLFPNPRRASNGPDSAFTDRVGGALGNPANAGLSRWDSKAQMPTARARLAVVAYEGRIYAIGGDTADGVTGAVEVYDPATDAWTRQASKHYPVRNTGAAVLGGRIYVPGGHNAMDEAIATVEVYDPASASWTEAAPLPTPLFAYAIAAVGDKLYLFGGSDGARYLSTVHIYDGTSNSWSTGTPMSQPRGFCDAAVVGERVYVIGGYDGQNESALCEVYDPVAEEQGEQPWAHRASLHMGRGGLAAVAADDYIYVIGGGWNQYLSFNERYDTNEDVWATFDSPLLGQWRTLGAALVSGEAGAVIYGIGGWSERHLSTNYAYRTFFRVYLPGL
jgi:DNA-binding CsgD family transcriptional regulator/N-acetylneuraminic acid mutarotase